MAYRIEFAVDPIEGLFQDIALVDQASRRPIPLGAVDHQLVICAILQEYGCWQPYDLLLASNSNGLITNSGPGVLSIAATGQAFVNLSGPYGDPWAPQRRTVRHKLLAVPPDPTHTKVLAEGTITFGGRSMQPRVTLGVVPFYPGSIGLPRLEFFENVSQLAPGGLSGFDRFIPASPDDPVRIAYLTQDYVTPTDTLALGFLTYAQDTTLGLSLTPTQAAALLAQILTA